MTEEKKPKGINEIILDSKFGKELKKGVDFGKIIREQLVVLYSFAEAHAALDKALDDTKEKVSTLIDMTREARDKGTKEPY